MKRDGWTLFIETAYIYHIAVTNEMARDISVPGFPSLGAATEKEI